MIGRKIDDLDCSKCYSEEVYLDVKEEVSLYKIGAYCDSCDYDYGFLTRIPQSEVEAVDEVYSMGEEAVTDLLEQR